MSVTLGATTFATLDYCSRRKKERVGKPGLGRVELTYHTSAQKTMYE